MKTLHTAGLICPEPIMLLHRTIATMNSGEELTIIATDPATTRDIPNFCRHLGHTLISHEVLGELSCEEGEFEMHYRYILQKK